MLYKRPTLVLLCLFITYFTYGQRETDNWYFGNLASLNFANGKPVVINDGNLSTPKGSTSISDKNGNLLFYTDGVYVFNKNHFGMQNGALLASDDEVLQSCIIIPNPDDENIYYLFTLKVTNDTPPLGAAIAPGLYFSTIDLSQNGGLGAVTKKNTALTSLASEKLTAVHAKDGKSFWVITFGKENSSSINYNTFYAYKIDETGVNRTPVTSEITIPASENNGALKVSPNGEYIAMSNNNTAIFANFNTETGSITSTDFLSVLEGFFPPRPFPTIHAIEFSQDSKHVYVESVNIPNGNNTIFQFKTDDLDDRQVVHVTDNIDAYANGNYMQLAKDGNIYLTTSKSETEGGNYLSQIVPPKSLDKTLATFNENTIDLLSAESILGLPNFVQSYFRTRVIAEDDCINTSLFFEVDTYANITAAEWDFGDGTTSLEIYPEHIYTSAGQYKITATITINNRQITVDKNITIYSPPEVIEDQKIIQCDFDNNGTDSFNLTTISNDITPFGNRLEIYYYETYTDYLNDNPIADPEDYTNISNPQTIYANIINSYGCSSLAEFTIESLFVELDNISNMYSCSLPNDGLNGSFSLELKEEEIRTNLGIPTTTNLRFYPDSNSAQTNRNELRMLNFVSPTTTIWVRADTSLGCGGIEPINLIVNTEPKINIADSYTICFDPSVKPPVIISADSINERFEWRNSKGDIISINQDFTLDAVGEFSLTVYKSENGLLCSNTKTFTVVNPEKAIFGNILVNTEDETNNIVEVYLNGNSNYEFSLDNITFYGNSTSYTFTNVEPGLRTIYVKDINDCEQPVEADITVIGFKKFFTPNGDGDNDYWNIKGIDANEFKSISVMIFDRYGKVIGSITDFNSLGWDGTYNGKSLISNNYWFKAEIIDKEDNIIEEAGNFSLIRN
ncbi:T9SS type B sorting domain-containing protein [Polaribacter sp. Asnod6-C07]|uniref:T9SS type B sorting domain-containing protein n=1 Tax=Polaribacter sp. Asnod6-C07 TaxID=3160582 RepID=UPI00386B483D